MSLFVECARVLAGIKMETTWPSLTIRRVSSYIVIFSDVSVCRMCSGLGWDKDGDNLAIINDKTGVILYCNFL